MRFLYVLALSLPLPFVASAVAVAENSMAQAAEEAMQCEIRTTRIPRGVHLESVVTSSIAANGTYDFKVEKSGGGATASTAQSGTFSVTAGGTTTLSQVNLGLSGADPTYTAQLIVRWNSGQVSCSVRHPERS